MKSKFSVEQKIRILREVGVDGTKDEICRKYNISPTTLYNWKQKYQGMDVNEAKRLNDLEKENARLKKLLADAMLDIDILKIAAGKNF